MAGSGLRVWWVTHGVARLHRAGELVAICIPAAGEEAVRELCRARADLDR
jgi:hypothetical protein